MKNHKQSLTGSHIINLDGDYGAQIYKARLRNSSNDFSTVSENNQILGVASFLNQLYGDAVITNPQTGIKCVINHNISPEVCYSISNGSYLKNCISLINEYIKKNDKVAVLGGGIGLLPVVSAIISANTCVCYEQDKNLHSIILKNSKLNNVDIQLELAQQCIINIKPEINKLIIGFSKQEQSLLNNVNFKNIETIILFENCINLDNKAKASIISGIIQFGFIMDTMVDGVYVFNK